MTKDTALRLALEALEKTQSALARCMGPHKSEEGDRHRALAYSRTTISAIKAALEANEFNPDWDTQAVLVEEIQRMAKRIEELEAKDEPVAWAEEIIDDLDALYNSEMIKENDSGDALIRLDAAVCVVEEVAQKHTTPPQRTWVGLTDEEIRACIASNKYAFEIVRAAEAKLKEKNA